MPPRKRGFILVVALFFLMLLSFIGTALVGLLPVEFRSSTRNQLDVQGHYAASAGIRYAANWFTAVITAEDTSSTGNEHWVIADNPITWQNPTYQTPKDIMAVPASDPDWELLKLQDLEFPKASFAYIAPTHTAGFGRQGNALCGYFGADAPDAANTYVVATKRPLRLGNDWDVWVAFVPHNDEDTPGSPKFPTGNAQVTNSRSYQMVAIAVYQNQPYMRAKAMVRESTTAKFARLMGTLGTPDDSAEATFSKSGVMFELGATTKDRVLYEGPVHSNEYLPISVKPEVWASTTAPFQGVMSYSNGFGMPGGWNQDDVRWARGNYGEFNQDYRPFTDNGNPAPLVDSTSGLNRYEALIKNGKANLQKQKTVPFPTDTSNLYEAAFGKVGTTVLTDVSPAYVDKDANPAILNGAFGEIYDGSGARIMDGGAPKKPQGLFINYSDTSGALGGVYVNGEVKAMMLESVRSDGSPEVSTSVLATATQGNSGIRVQEQKLSQRPVTVTAHVTATTRTTSTTYTTVTNVGTTVTTGTNRTTITNRTTGLATTTNLSTSLATVTNTNASVTQTNRVSTTFTTTTNRTTSYTSQTNMGTSTSTSFSTNRVPTSTTSQFVADADGSGNSGWVRQTNYATNVTTNRTTSTSAVSTTRNGTTTNQTTTTNRTGTIFATVTNRTTVTTTNRTGTVTNRTTGTATSTSFTTSTAFGTATSVGTSTATNSNRATSTSLTTATQETVLAETWNAIDRAILPKDSSVTIGTVSGGQVLVNMGGTNYSRSPAGRNPSFQMDTLKATNMVAYDGKTGLPLTSQMTVSTNELLVMKQSRTDPNQVFLFKVPKGSGKDGTNGAVFIDGNINGLGGVNVGKRNVTVRNDSSGQKDISIADNIVQLGTAVGQKPATHSNGLGMMANNVNIVADNNNFGDLAANPLEIYGIILAGKSTADGGLRIKRATEPNRPLFVDATAVPAPIGATSRYMQPADVATYNTAVESGAVNDNSRPFDMNYLLGDYRNWRGSTPFFRLYGGLLERQPKVIYNSGTYAAGWRSSFLYDQYLANNPPPFWPSAGQPEILSYTEERL